MKRSELQDIVRDDPLLKSTGFVTDARLNVILNEGARDMARRTKAIVLSATWSAVASTQRYILSGGGSEKVTGYLEPYWWDGIIGAGALVYTPTSGNSKVAPNDFQFTSESKLDLDEAGWQDRDANDTLQKVFLGYDSSGFLNLGVHPQSKSSTPSFKLYFVSKGVDMSTDNNHPWVNDTNGLPHLSVYEEGIAFYALWRLHTVKTKQFALADRFLVDYLAMVKDMKEAADQVNRMEIYGTRAEDMVTAGQTFGGGH